jgi:hypothetical protein
MPYRRLTSEGTIENTPPKAMATTGPPYKTVRSAGAINRVL